ncbi:MAG: hypothetical protein PHC51_10600 [bacterium]|nr:hypothetical protein [bacterium]
MIKPLIVTMVVSLLIWVATVSLSNNTVSVVSTSHQAAAEHSGVAGNAEVQEPDALVSLRNQSKAKSDDLELKLQFAEALMAHAYTGGSMSAMKEAIAEYQSVLVVDAKRPEALQALGRAYFDAAMYEKAEQYYRDYLTIKSEDTRARVELALLQLRLNRAEDAIPIFESVLELGQEKFQARFGLALARQLTSDLEGALNEANIALSEAPDENARARVKEFIAHIGGSDVPAAAQASVNSAAEMRSPATELQDYFSNHPIIGAKIKAQRWKDATHFEITVADFPVAQMPPFARQAFEGKVKERLAAFTESIEVGIVDAVSGEELIRITR